MPSRWAQLGSSIGGGLGKGFGTAVENYMQPKMDVAQLAQKIKLIDAELEKKGLPTLTQDQITQIYSNALVPKMDFQQMLARSMMGGQSGSSPGMPDINNVGGPPVGAPSQSTVAPFGIWVDDALNEYIPLTKSQAEQLEKDGARRK